METTKNKTTLLIMAAGMGSRFGSLKQLALLGPHKKTLLHYSIYDAVHAGFDKIVFIICRSFENEFKEAVGKYAESLVETVYCFQEMDQLPGNLPRSSGKKPWERLTPSGPQKTIYTNRLSRSTPMTFTDGMLS